MPYSRNLALLAALTIAPPALAADHVPVAVSDHEANPNEYESALNGSNTQSVVVSSAGVAQIMLLVGRTTELLTPFNPSKPIGVNGCCEGVKTRWVEGTNAVLVQATKEARGLTLFLSGTVDDGSVKVYPLWIAAIDNVGGEYSAPALIKLRKLD